MIVYTLRCGLDHEFEAWFRDSATYDRQSKAGKVACAICGDMKVVKAPMAPRLNSGVGDARGEASSAPSPEGERVPGPAEMKQLFLALRQHIEQNAENVGDKFAEEARKIHYNEAPARGIYGDATEDEARDLEEEGVPVGRIPWVRYDS